MRHKHSGLPRRAILSGAAAASASFKKFGLPSRPHAKTHKCAAIAKYQMVTGSIGTRRGRVDVMGTITARGKSQ